MSCLYLLHFHPSYQHARHYLGWTAGKDPCERIRTHLLGRGSPLIKAAIHFGCRILVADTFPGDRIKERLLKRRSHVRAWCPLCDQVAYLESVLRTGELDASAWIEEHATRRGRVAR